jgi:hypothetical protein
VTAGIETRLRAWPVALGLALGVFLFGALLMLPVLGLQYDEVMFASHFWQPLEAVWHIGIRRHQIPLMMMSYLGSLKTWLYAPLLAIAPGNAWTIRLPAVLLATLSLVVFALLLFRIADRFTGCIAALLLATDATFQLTAVFDWGPVVIQNLLLVGGLLAIVNWIRTRDARTARLGGLLFGLALWNKALFLWNLSGMAVALLALALPELKRLWDWRSAKFFLAGLAIGASPLIVYNIAKHGGTVSQNSHFGFSEVPAKAAYMERALDGTETPLALVDPQHARMDQAARPFKNLLLDWAAHLPPVPRTWRFPGGLFFITAGLIASGKSHKKWIAFFLLSGLIGWFESAITQGAGGSIHHSVLFWMNWYAAIAIGAASLTKFRVVRPVAVLAVLFLTLTGFESQVITYANLVRFGAKPQWTDGDGALISALQRQRVKRVLTTDWGIANVITTETRHHVQAREEVFGLSTGAFETDEFAGCSFPECAVITHPEPNLFFPASDKTLRSSLQQKGMQIEAPATVYDTHGFPAFELFSVKTHLGDERY